MAAWRAVLSGAFRDLPPTALAELSIDDLLPGRFAGVGVDESAGVPTVSSRIRDLHPEAGAAFELRRETLVRR